MSVAFCMNRQNRCYAPNGVPTAETRGKIAERRTQKEARRRRGAIVQVVTTEEGRKGTTEDGWKESKEALLFNDLNKDYPGDICSWEKSRILNADCGRVVEDDSRTRRQDLVP